MFKKTFTIVFSLLLISFKSYGNSAKLIGYTALSDKIFQRIFEPGADISLIDLFYFEQSPETFKQLLGHYEATPEGDLIENGDPNAFNFILLSVLVDNIASTIANECEGETINLAFSVYEPEQYVVPTPQLRASFQNAVKKFCHWPLSGVQAERALEDFFLRVTMFELPSSEQDAWINEFLSVKYKAKEGREVLYDMTYSVLMNPYFLFKQ